MKQTLRNRLSVLEDAKAVGKVCIGIPLVFRRDGEDDDAFLARMEVEVGPIGPSVPFYLLIEFVNSISTDGAVERRERLNVGDQLRHHVSQVR